MPRIMKPIDVDNLVQRYQAGETIEELAREFNVSVTPIRSRLLENGIHIRTGKEAWALRRIHLPDTEVIQRYSAGESELQLSQAFDVTRSTIRRILIENNIHVRTQSEAESLKWSQFTPEQKAAQTAAAHAASKGRHRSIEERIQAAHSRELNCSGATLVETEFANRLRMLGLNITQQKAVSVYNLDIAVNIPPIAIEIFGGSFHASGKHLATFHKRTKYLLDSGWTVVIIWVDGKRYPLSIGSDHYITTLIQEMSTNPSLRSQYRVILGNGQLASTRKSYFNTPTDIERLRGGN